MYGFINNDGTCRIHLDRRNSDWDRLDKGETLNGELRPEDSTQEPLKISLRQAPRRGPDELYFEPSPANKWELGERIAFYADPAVVRMIFQTGLYLTKYKGTPISLTDR